MVSLDHFAKTFAQQDLLCNFDEALAITRSKILRFGQRYFAKTLHTIFNHVLHVSALLDDLWPLTGWEQSSPVDEEKIKMDDSVARFFTRFRGNLFICWLVEGAALSRRTQNEIVVSWITLWGMIKVYWLDFSLHFRSCCLLRVCRKFGPKLASHYKPVENEVKFVELPEPCSAK